MDFSFLLNIPLSVLSIIVVFALTKLIGNKQMSQLNMFDYIYGITIGSIAAEMATDIENFEKPLTAMIIYGIIGFLVSLLSIKSVKIRQFVSGPPIILYNNGKFYDKNLKKARLDVHEFLYQARSNGFFNIADLQTALLEPNGKISFLPLSDRRPATPSDMNLMPEQEKIPANVIVDGKIMFDALKGTGNDLKWLENEIKKQGFSVREVFLAVCDSSNNLTVYKKQPPEKSKAILYR